MPGSALPGSALPGAARPGSTTGGAQLAASGLAAVFAGTSRQGAAATSDDYNATAVNRISGWAPPPAGASFPAPDTSGPDPSLVKTCRACNEKINGEYVFVGALTYHPDCCKCENCSAVLRPPHGYLYRGHLRCAECVAGASEYPTCPVCQIPLLPSDERVTPREGMAMHAGCFVCFECGALLQPGQFTEYPEGFVCADCNRQVELRRCAVCERPILGRYRKHRGRYWHIEHFQCCECHSVLMGNNFFVHHNDYYCPNDGAIFSKMCQYCKSEFSGAESESITWRSKVYHSKCFVCRVCGGRCDPENSKHIHRRPHCDRCFRQRVADHDANDHGHATAGHKHSPAEIQARRTRFDEAKVTSIVQPRSKKEMLKVTEDVGEYHVTRVFHGRKVKGRIHKHIRKRRTEHHPVGTPKRRSYRHSTKEPE